MHRFKKNKKGRQEARRLLRICDMERASRSMDSVARRPGILMPLLLMMRMIMEKMEAVVQGDFRGIRRKGRDREMKLEVEIEVEH